MPLVRPPRFWPSASQNPAVIPIVHAVNLRMTGVIVAECFDPFRPSHCPSGQDKTRNTRLVTCNMEDVSMPAAEVAVLEEEVSLCSCSLVVRSRLQRPLLLVRTNSQSPHIVVCYSGIGMIHGIARKTFILIHYPSTMRPQVHEVACSRQSYRHQAPQQKYSRTLETGRD